MNNIQLVIDAAEQFSTELISVLQNPTMQEAAKTAYFMDNQEKVSEHMSNLKNVINLFKDLESLTPEQTEYTDKAKVIAKSVKDAITLYQTSLNVNPDITPEQSTASLTNETISDAMQNNETTKQIHANMTAIAEQQQALAKVPFNYALYCDGALHMINAVDNNQLVKTINQVANTGNYKDIRLYEMKLTPVKLHQKTILTL